MFTQLQNVTISLTQRNAREFVVSIDARYTRDNIVCKSFYTLPAALAYYNVAQTHYKSINQ